MLFSLESYIVHFNNCNAISFVPLLYLCFIKLDVSFVFIFKEQIKSVAFIYKVTVNDEPSRNRNRLIKICSTIHFLSCQMISFFDHVEDDGCIK